MMADIFEYLDWRADVPFSVDPFNEVDNLVLSVLAYVDFSGIVPSTGSEIPLSSAYNLFFQLHAREEILASKAFIEKAPFLMEKMLGSPRFGGMRLCRYINDIDVKNTAQISAVTFLMDDGTAYVAYRGTDSSFVGWKEDFDIACLTETSGQQDAVQYLEETASVLEMPLRVGGHSKGGNFAMFASSFCREEVQNQIISVYTNDGPGFRKEITEKDGYLRILPKIQSIVPDTSIIGMILTNPVNHQVVKSAASGILQHDGFSWLVKRNHFEHAEFSDSGKLFHETLDRWIDGMDDDTRKSFTDTIFSVIESTGLDNFHDISIQKWKSAEAMLNALLTMPREKQSELFHLARQLVHTGGQAALEQLPEKLHSQKTDD